MSQKKPRNIILTGFMGSGKTTVGRLLANKTGFTFVDTDAEIVQKTGLPIAKIFAEQGEEAFRELETETLESLQEKTGLVVSTGGGIVLRERNRELLDTLGYVVWLAVEPEAVIARVGKNRDRPLLNNDNPHSAIRGLLGERIPIYKAASDLHIDTGELSAEEIAYGIKECAQMHFAGTTP